MTFTGNYQCFSVQIIPVDLIGLKTDYLMAFMIDISQKSPFYLYVHNRTCKSCSDRVARISICFLRVFRQRRLDSCWRFNAKDYEGRFSQNWCFFLQETKSLHFRGDQKLAKQIVNPPKWWAALTHRYS